MGLSWKSSQVSMSELDSGKSLQLRCDFDGYEDVVADYADRMSDGDEFPAVKIVKDGELMILVDGHARIRAMQKIGVLRFKADMAKGTVRDALEFAVGVNEDHGIRRTKADRYNSVLMVLKDREWGIQDEEGRCGLTERKIADMCRVSQSLVSLIKGAYMSGLGTPKAIEQSGGLYDLGDDDDDDEEEEYPESGSPPEAPVPKPSNGKIGRRASVNLSDLNPAEKTKVIAKKFRGLTKMLRGVGMLDHTSEPIDRVLQDFTGYVMEHMEHPSALIAELRITKVTVERLLMMMDGTISDET
jgi:hypothetical protein